MPKGPKGQKRPNDTIQSAVKVAKIATGEIEEDKPKRRSNSGRGRAESLSAEKRKEIAKIAASARWKDKAK